MRDPKIPPLDPSLARLVRREQALGRTAAPAKEAAYAQVQAKLALAASATASAAAAAKLGAVVTKGSTAARTALLLAKLATIASLGGALAVVVVGRTGVAPSAPRPAASAPAVAASHVAAPAIAAASASTPTPSADPPTSDDEPFRPPSRRTAAPITETRHRSMPTASDGRPAPDRDDGTLAEERRLLDHAQGALAQHDSTGALDDVGLHARRFPNGELQAEREAIAIRALVIAGRVGDAEARARRFRAAYPNNLLGPAVEAAVRREK